MEKHSERWRLNFIFILEEDKTKGKLEVGLKEEFLRSITNDSEFQAEVFVEMTRIKSGEVENKQTHVVNGIEVESNTVKTTTPEPPKTPETPTPKPQTPAKKVLPIPELMQVC